MSQENVEIVRQAVEVINRRAPRRLSPTSIPIEELQSAIVGAALAECDRLAAPAAPARPSGE
jgi:hypothetical protein